MNLERLQNDRSGCFFANVLEALPGKQAALRKRGREKMGFDLVHFRL